MRTEPGIAVFTKGKQLFLQDKSVMEGTKVKTLWAVACAAIASVLVLAVPAFCAEEAKPPEPAMVAPGGPTSQGGLEYRLGPEDVLRVAVWENRELTLDVVVRPDGKISFPLIQDVQAEGLTAAELSSAIHQRLQSFIKDPQVSVIVTQVNAPKIYVIGNVTRPGPYPLRSETSILQALSLAGGFTQFASPRSIKLVRGTGAKQEVRKVNYYSLIDDRGEGNYVLKPGDTIVVP
jgi:polysaccharide export outer membrane protein